MFETIIALLIKRYVARYFDINADQLSAQLLYKQQIIIENLTLNKTTLNEDIRTKLKFPVKIEAFQIDRIRCSFILSSLFFRSSSPALIVKIDGVHVVIQPAILDESSVDTSEENQVLKKQNQLNLAEQQLEKEFECFGEVKSSRWNMRRLLMSFCEKLQIEIHDIHISYQSSALHTIGFTCESLQIANESSDETMSRQVLRMTNLGLYIDSQISSPHCYILSPLTSMEIHLTHNHFLVSQKEYRYELECSLKDLTMKCRIEQVQIIADTIRSIQYSSLRHMLLSDPSRPLSKQSAKAWWCYAILSVLRIQGVPNSQFWFNRARLKHRLQRLIAYQRLYRAYVDHKYFKSSNFTSEDELAMNEIEREFDIEHLVIVRRSIFQTRISEQLVQKKETERWYSNYAKWITTKVIDLWGNTALDETDIKIQEQVNTFIAESLEDEDLAENFQNALIFRLQFDLQSIQINLLSSNNATLFSFHLKNLSASAEFRLRHRSIVTSICLEDLYVRDHEQVESLANIISSKERSEHVPIFEFSFEKKRKSKTSKQSVYTIRIRSCGLCIVCSPATMERLHNLYCSTFGSSIQTLSVSLKNWKRIKRYTVGNLISIMEQIIPTPVKSRLQHRRREKRIIQIDLNIGVPQIVIPLSPQGALIVDLGSVILTNDAVSVVQEDDEEEFLTPESSPLINDEPLEEEMTYYSINTIPTEIEYASFSLAVHDIELECSIDRLQIVEKFSIHFLVQHRLDHLWPLINLSGTIQRMILHLNPPVIQTFCDSIHPWIALIDSSIEKQHYQLDIWPALSFHLDEMNLQLSDQSQTLCNIRLQNLDLSFTDNHPMKNLVLTLQTLTIFDNTQQSLLRTDVNDNFIRIHTDFSTTFEVNVNANRLDFVFNPQTICALINFLLNTKLHSWKLKRRTNFISCQINSTFRELNIVVIDITSMLVSTEFHLQPVLLNILLKNTENDTYRLSMKMTSISYIHSPHLIGTLQQILDYMAQNCHGITSQASSIDRKALKIIFLVDIDRIEVRNDHTSLASRHVEGPLLENICISFNLQISDTSIKIDSKLISPLRIYLNQHRIKLLQTPSLRRTSSSSISRKFAFHLYSTEIIVIFQTHRNDQLVNVCEAILNPCQMIYESESSQDKKIVLQLGSLHMREPSFNSAESFMVFTSIQLVDNPRERIDIRLSKIDIRFTESTWKILSELIEIMHSAGIHEKKNHPKEISIHIDSIACRFQDDRVSLMSINLQRFHVSIISSTIHGQMGFISIHDLTTIDQLYSERLYTTGTNVITFTLTIEKDHSVRSKFHLQLKSIQYIHTQSFLSSLIDYLNRLRSFLVKPMFSQTHEIRMNIGLENTILILPEHILRKPVLVFQVGYIQLSTSLSNLVTVKMKDIDFYSSSHCSIDVRSSLPLRFSAFGFSRADIELSSMVRQPFHLKIEMERNLDKLVNPTSPSSIIKIHLSSLDILFDINHYHLIENILTHNLNHLWTSLIVQEDSIHTDFACIIEIDHVGLEIFMVEMDLLSFCHRRSVGYAALAKLHLSFDQYTNGNQAFHLLCSTMKLVDTRMQHEHMILPLSMPSDANQLEIYLLRSRVDTKCTINMSDIRFLVVIDWLLALNEFLNLFCDQPGINSMNIPIGVFEMKLNLNQFDLILVSTTKDPYSSALIYSSTMMINYKQGTRPLECIFNDFTFLVCQIGNIDETKISIIEPTDCSLNIQPSNELLDEQICELTIPLLNIRLSYSDIHMIYSLIYTITKQISQAKTRKPLLAYISSVLTSPLRTLQSTAARFLNMKFLKFLSDQICVCLIDDCFGVNIPLLNIHLKPFILQTIENSHSIRTDQCEFDLSISYYNRFQSGFEPLIERCPLQMTFSRSPSSTLLFISSKEILNLNFTKALYRLIGMVKTDWLQKTKKEVSYRRVKPSDPYCFKNLLGIGVKFRTWIIAEQRFSSSENTVEDNQTVSFCFPTRSSPTRQRMNSLVASLFQSNRRILITIDGWEPLQPISIDRVGTFFRLAKSSHHQQLYKPILAIIDIAMTSIHPIPRC